MARHQEPEPQTTDLVHRGRVHNPSTLGSPRYHLVQGPVPSGTVMIRTDCEFHRAEEDGSFFHSPTKKAQFSGQKPLRGSIELDNYPEEIAQQRQLLFSLQFPSQGYSRGEEQKLNTRGVLTRSQMPTQHRCVSGACPRDFRESKRMRRQSAAVSPKYCTTKTWWLGNPEAENWRTGRVPSGDATSD